MYIQALNLNLTNKVAPRFGLQVLTRKPDEAIIINEQIGIKVLKIDGNKVKLGIQAPEDMYVDRESVFEKRTHTQFPWTHQ